MGYIKNYQELAITNERKIVLDLIEAGIYSIQPQKVLDDNFSLKNLELKIKDKKFNLKDYEKVFLIGFGKGSARISYFLEEKLGTFLTKGFVIDTESEDFRKIEFIQGTHPLPSQENLDFTTNVLEQ